MDDPFLPAIRNSAKHEKYKISKIPNFKIRKFKTSTLQLSTKRTDSGAWVVLPPWQKFQPSPSAVNTKFKINEFMDLWIFDILYFQNFKFRLLIIVQRCVFRLAAPCTGWKLVRSPPTHQTRYSHDLDPIPEGHFEIDRFLYPLFSQFISPQRWLSNQQRSRLP